MGSLSGLGRSAAKSLQSCPTLCDPIDGGPPGSPVPGILQARTLEWAAISFSNVWKWKGKVKSFSHVQLLAPPWTAAYQAPPSIGFSRQEYYLSHQESPLKNIHIKKKKLNWSVMIANETVKNDLCVRKQRTAGKIKSQVTWTPTIKDSVLALHFMNGWPPLALHLFV